jgi:hypothetical protein
MKTEFIVFIFCLLFIPTVAFPFDFDKSRDLILDRAAPWTEKVKLIDEIAPLGSEKVLEVLVTVYEDSFLHFGCPSILYHTVNGLRYFRGNKRAIRIVRDGINYREPEVRMISLEVLGVIGSEEDLEVLKPFLTNKNSFESHFAQSAIENIKMRVQRSAL